jgi:hypothetical protein
MTGEGKPHLGQGLAFSLTRHRTTNRFNPYILPLDLLDACSIACFVNFSNKASRSQVSISNLWGRSKDLGAKTGPKFSRGTQNP